MLLEKCIIDGSGYQTTGWWITMDFSKFIVFRLYFLHVELFFTSGKYPMIVYQNIKYLKLKANFKRMNVDS